MLHKKDNNTKLDGTTLYSYMTSDIVLSDFATGNITFQPNAGIFMYMYVCV
jgi:hypothetical protein